MRNSVITATDTCCEFFTPRLVDAGRDITSYAVGEQCSLIVISEKVRFCKKNIPMLVVVSL